MKHTLSLFSVTRVMVSAVLVLLAGGTGQVLAADFYMGGDGASDRKPLYTPLFLRSLDQGHSWDLLGEIPYGGDPEADPSAGRRDGFTEPDCDFRADGSVIRLMRTSDGYGHGPL